MICLLFKRINPYTNIGVSNLKEEIERSTNYSNIIDKVERHEDYVCHILRDVLSGKNST